MDKLKEKIATAIPDHLVFLDLIAEHGSNRIKIVVDGQQPIDLKTTTQIAREVQNSNMLDDMFPNGVQLEVTSPGIDAPLIHPIQFQKNIGRLLRVLLFGESEPITLELTDVDTSSFIGKISSGDLKKFRYDQVESAKVVIQF